MEKSPSSQIIMVVDSSYDVGELLRRQLEMLGYSVVEAADGLEAVILAKLEGPDLILMGISLPNLDGLSAIRAIRWTEGQAKCRSWHSSRSATATTVSVHLKLDATTSL